MKGLPLSSTSPYVRALNGAPISSFSIRSSWYDDRDCADWASGLAEDLQFLYNICCFLSLTRLSIDGLQCWTREGHIKGYGERRETKASDVSDRALRNTGTPGDGPPEVII